MSFSAEVIKCINHASVEAVLDMEHTFASYSQIILELHEMKEG